MFRESDLLPSFLRVGSNTAVVVPVVRFMFIYFIEHIAVDLRRNLAYRVLLVECIIFFKNAPRLQFVERGRDLLKSSIDDRHRFVYLRFSLVGPVVDWFC